VLLTDGQVGNEDQILRRLGERVKHVRIFTLGIDRAVNEGFLRRLAELGGGLYDLVESEERLEEVLEKFHHRIGRPVLSGLRIDAEGLSPVADSQVPERTPDLFPGTPLVLLGRYRGAPKGGFVLTANDASQHECRLCVPARLRDNLAIGFIWARGQVRKLEDRFAAGRHRDGADRGALERQIVETSLRYRVLSRFTAYVAVDAAELVNEGGGGAQVTQPVETPGGWKGSMPAVAMAPAAAMPEGLRGGLARSLGRQSADRGAVDGLDDCDLGAVAPVTRGSMPKTAPAGEESGSMVTFLPEEETSGEFKCTPPPAQSARAVPRSHSWDEAQPQAFGSRRTRFLLLWVFLAMGLLGLGVWLWLH
jgi:Ca-activated chloride channel family protein